MRYSTAFAVLGLGLMLVAIATANHEPRIFSLPDDQAALDALNTEDFWRNVVVAVGGVVAVVAFVVRLFWKRPSKHQTDGN